MNINARTLRWCTLALALLLTGLSTTSLYAQPGEVDDSNLTESGRPEKKKPRDNFYDRYIYTEKRILEYDFIHEKDVFWEKRIWRLIDVKEKMNHPFTYEVEPFVTILIDAINAGDMMAYSTESFQEEYTKEQIDQVINRVDTTMVFDPETFTEIPMPVYNKIDMADIHQFRIKEVWFFDEETSKLSVRILGFCPLYDKKNDNGDVVAILPLFWVYYPDCREILARHEAFNEFNDAQRRTWDDIFEARQFSSYIIKESNVHDRSIKDYTAVGTPEPLLEAEKIKDGIFHFEHDLWEY